MAPALSSCASRLKLLVNSEGETAREEPRL
jgi:hypothetical protein